MHDIHGMFSVYVCTMYVRKSVYVERSFCFHLKRGSDKMKRYVVCNVCRVRVYEYVAWLVYVLCLKLFCLLATSFACQSSD